MKQQIIFLDGGTPKENSDSYYEFLQQQEYNPYEEKFLNWNKTLQEKLGNDYEILRAAYSGIDFADYEAWKIMFEKMLPYMSDDAIIIVTSLGGTFLLKYLSEGNTLPVTISKLFFLAPALNDSPQEKLGSFSLDKEKLQNIPEDIAREIYIYHSTDDDIVDIADSRELHSIFPNATFREFNDRGHWYLEERIPEIEEDIQS